MLSAKRKYSSKNLKDSFFFFLFVWSASALSLCIWWNFSYRFSDVSKQIISVPTLEHRNALFNSALTPNLQLLEQETLWNLPNFYFTHKEYRVLPNKKFHKLNRSCYFMPQVFDLNYNNIFWQNTKLGDATFYIYSAYLDNRETLKPEGSLSVRILSLIDRYHPPNVTCRLWFDKESGDAKVDNVTSSLKLVPYDVQAQFSYMWYRQWGSTADGILQPFLISCQLPIDVEVFRGLLPLSVSLIKEPSRCELPSNNIRIVHEPQDSKEGFAVCVKGLSYPAPTHSPVWPLNSQGLPLSPGRLAEWINLLLLQGVSKIYIYLFSVSAPLSALLDYYKRKGTIEIVPITLAGFHPNLPHLRHQYLKRRSQMRRLQEIIPYNDCLYRTIYRYKYMIVMDVDEAIVPLSVLTWNEFMEELDASNQTSEFISSYHLRNLYFFDDDGERDLSTAPTSFSDEEMFQDVPESMHMTRHLWHAKNVSPPHSFVKSIHLTDRVLTVHNHFAWKDVDGKHAHAHCIDPSVARLHHYRKSCQDISASNCNAHYRNGTVFDSTLWRYKDRLVASVREDLEALGLYEDV